jgi:hypothetical protein
MTMTNKTINKTRILKNCKNKNKKKEKTRGNNPRKNKENRN